MSTLPPPGTNPTSGTLEPGAGPPRRSRGPWITIGLVVLVVAAAAVVFFATRDDDEPSASGGGTLLGFSYDEGEVQVLDRRGEVTEAVDVPGTDDERFPAVGPNGTLVFDDAAEGGAAYVVSATGETTEFEVPTELTYRQQPLLSSGRIVFDQPAGGDVAVLDLASGDTTLVSEELDLDDPLLIYGGLVGNATSYVSARGDLQSVVIPHDGAEIWLLAGRVVDVDGPHVLTGSEVDQLTALTVYEGDEELASTDVAAEIAGAILTGGTTALAVTGDGDLLGVDLDSGEVDEIGSLDDRVRFAVRVGADRLLAVGDDDATTFLIGPDGETIAEFESALDADGQDRAMSPAPNGARPGARCVALQPGAPVAPDGIDALLVDTTNGETVAEFDGSPVLLPTPDGCSAAVPTGDEAHVVLDGEERTFDGYSSINAVSPDLETVVVFGPDGFARVDVDSGDEVEIDPGIYTFAPEP